MLEDVGTSCVWGLQMCCAEGLEMKRVDLGGGEERGRVDGVDGVADFGHALLDSPPSVFCWRVVPWRDLRLAERLWICGRHARRACECASVQLCLRLQRGPCCMGRG